MLGSKDTWHIGSKRDSGWFTCCGIDCTGPEWTHMVTHLMCATYELGDILDTYEDDVVCDACMLLAMDLPADLEMP